MVFRWIVEVTGVVKRYASHSNITIPQTKTNKYSNHSTRAMARYRPVVDILIFLPRSFEAGVELPALAIDIYQGSSPTLRPVDKLLYVVGIPVFYVPRPVHAHVVNAHDMARLGKAPDLLPDIPARANDKQFPLL
jgi:hypothetical protein